MRHLCSLFPLLALLLTGGCSTYKGADDNSKSTSHTHISEAAPDSVVASILGESISSIIFTPDSVTAAKVTEANIVTPTTKTRTYGPMLPMKEVSDKDLQLLQLAFLSDPRNYTNDTIIMMSPYIPAMELDFYRNGEVVKMTVSFSDATWNLTKDGKEIINYNYRTEEPILKIYKTL